MGLKRFLLIAAFVLSASVVLVPGAVADDFADQPCPDVAGPDTSTCPPGTQGTPYSLQFQLAEGSGCGPGLTTWSVSSGSFPPGLSLNSGNGAVSGTPTQAGNFTFYIKVSYPVLTDPACNGGFSDHKFTIPIKPETPRLILGPEQSGVPKSTVGAAFSLQMTSNLPDGKTWSISAGQLPPGLALNTTDGLISGTPTTAETYTFTVQAVLPDGRSDTKTLAIVVRSAVAIAAPAPTPAEVSVPLELALSATGGTQTFVWALASGALPRGVELGTDGSIAGTPRAAGTFRFSVTATDTEGRLATYAGRLSVAAKLVLPRQLLRQAQVGRLYRVKIRSTGGVLPKSWKVTGGLPRGIRLDRSLGVLSGTPKKAGRYRITVAVTDGLDVTSTRAFTIVVRPAPVK